MVKLKSRFLNFTIFGALGLAATTFPAMANFSGSVSGSCASGSSCAEGAVGASATYSYDSSTQLLSIWLTNTSTTQETAAQTLTGFFFNPVFSGAGSIAAQPTAATFIHTEGSGPSEYGGYLCAGGSCSTVSASSPSISVAAITASGQNKGWGYTSSAGGPTPPSGFSTGLVAGNGSGKPFGIVNDYITGKASMSNSNHNPWILATTFVLKVTGNLTSIGDSFYFGFGTSSGTGFTARPPSLDPVPEPSYAAVLVLGLGALLFFRRKRVIA